MTTGTERPHPWPAVGGRGGEEARVTLLLRGYEPFVTGTVTRSGCGNHAVENTR